MLSLYRTVHTLLGFADDKQPPKLLHRCRNILPAYGDGLHILAGDSPGAPNVLVSSAVGRPPERLDPGARGLHELVYGEGLGLCTEGLGSESCDGGMEAEEMAGNEEAWGWRRSLRRRKLEARRRRPLPPPLPWLAGGQSRMMLAVREDGRFRLMEVQLEGPPEILLTSRAGGRLRMDLVVRSDAEDEERDIAPGQEEREGATAIAQEAEEEEDDDDGDQEEEEEIEIGEEVEDEEEEVRLWPERMVIPTRKGEERCQEMVSSNGAPMWWNQRPIMTA